MIKKTHQNMSEKTTKKCDPASTGEPVARNDHLDLASTECRVACDVGTLAFRIQGLSHSTVEEAEYVRVRELIDRIENHLDRDELQADLMQNNIYNPFSENSKKMIHDTGNVEYFELCETTSKEQCSYCLSWWAKGIVYCICGNCLCHTESTRQLPRNRFDALSISNCRIFKGMPS